MCNLKYAQVVSINLAIVREVLGGPAGDRVQRHLLNRVLNLDMRSYLTQIYRVIFLTTKSK